MGLVESVARFEGMMSKSYSWFLTALVAFFGTAITLFFLYAGVTDQREAIDRTIDRVTIEVKNEITSRIETQNRALMRMAGRWGRSGGTPRDQWEEDAWAYIADYESFKAIEWVDSTFHVRWIVPLEGNEAAVDLDLGFEPRRRRALESARNNRIPTMTHPIRLVQGGLGMLAYVPISVGDRFDGFILGVYQVDTMFDQILSPDVIASGYGIYVLAGEEFIYERLVGSPTNREKFSHKDTFDLYSVPIEVSVWPDEKTLQAMRSDLPMLVVVGGLSVTALMTWVAHLGQIVWARSRQLESTNQEIREQSRQRETAQAELSRHALAISGAFDGIAILDAKGCYTYMNLAHARIYGYEDPTELIGSSWEKMYFAEQVQEIRQEGYDALAERGQWHGELTGKRFGGERFDVEVSLTSLEDGGLVCVCRDITGRKTAEHAVRESQARLQGILDNTSAVVYMKELSGRYLLVNKRFEHLFGLSREQICGKKDHEIFPADVAEAFRANDQAVAERGEVIQLEEIVPQDDGIHTYVSIKFPMRDINGETYAVAGISTDITKLKNVEKALRESEQRFELAVKGSQDGLWDWLDVEGDEEWWSPRFYELLGYDDLEIPARMSTFESFLHEDDAQAVIHAIQAHFEDGAPFDIEYRLRCKDGEYRWFRARGESVRDESGKPIRMAGSLQDIHERMLTQNELQGFARQLEESNRELENFVHTVSHDLKSPLVTFTGFLSHLQNDVDQGRTDRLGGYIEFMQRAAVRMRETIHDLLEISRIGRESSNPESIDVAMLVQSLVTDHASQIKSLGVTVEVDSSLPSINLDRIRLKQLMDNLINNALKYGCTADKPVIRVGGQITEEDTRFYVSDNGPGIDARYHKKIFGVFQRMSSDGDGTGVGLAIVARVTEVYGGRAWVESEPGQGSTFWVSFPRETVHLVTPERANRVRA